jgi:RimJ/RimL family protein N-acetyltransferase
MTQPILTSGDIVLVPTVVKDIDYIWGLLDQWESGSVWKSMYKDYQEFRQDLEGRLKNPTDMLWTMWTKAGKSSKKFGVILLSDICYGLSAEVHGVIDKSIYQIVAGKQKPKFTLADKALRMVLKYCFNDLGVARVNGTFYQRSPLIEALLRRNGFKRNALLRKSVYVNGEIRDTYIFGILEDDFLLDQEV